MERHRDVVYSGEGPVFDRGGDRSTRWPRSLCPSVFRPLFGPPSKAWQHGDGESNDPKEASQCELALGRVLTGSRLGVELGVD